MRPSLSGKAKGSAADRPNRRAFKGGRRTLERTAQAVAQQIIQQGYFARPLMGISFQPINPQIAARYGLGAQWGVYITRVISGSPADQAGVTLARVEVPGEEGAVSLAAG